MADLSGLSALNLGPALAGLSRLGSVPQVKQAEVAQVAQQKKTELSLPSAADLANIATGRLNPRFQDRSIPVASQPAADVANLDAVSLLNKYGSTAAPMISGKLNAEGHYQGLAGHGGRDTADVIGDSTIDIASGFANSLAGIGALGLGVVNADAGTSAAAGIGKANAWVQDHLQTDQLNLAREKYAADQALSSAMNADQASKDKAAGDGDLVAGLKKIGRDAVDAVQNTNGEVLQSGIANAGGSLLAAAPVAKGVGLISKPLAEAVAVGEYGPSRVAKMITDATMPAAIGLMEGGGAYQQTADQALQMGADPQAANQAGLEAAAIQAPVAAATGTLVSKFEKAPFHVGSVGEAVGNMAREGIEETLQSGAGQLAQNLGLKHQVDPNQDLTAGVGEQAAQGGLFGALSAGVTQAPGGAAHIVADAGKSTVDLGKLAVNEPLVATAKGFKAGKAAEIQGAADQALQAGAGLTPEDLAASPPAAGAASAPAVSPAQAFLDTLHLQSGEAEQHAPRVAEVVRNARNRLDAIDQVSQIAADPNATPEDQLAAGRYLAQFQAEHAPKMVEALNAAAAPLADDHPHVQPDGVYQKAMNAIDAAQGAGNPRIKAAIEAAKTAAADPQMTEKALASDQAQQHADAVVDLAAAHPESANPEVLDVIRQHAVNGKIKLSLQQQAILSAASTLVRLTQDRAQQAEKQGLQLTRGDWVSNEAQNKGGVTGLGAADHAREAIKAWKSGDTEAAQGHMNNLQLLAEHYQRKLDATNESLQSGKKVTYSALQPMAKRGFGVDARYDDTVQIHINHPDDGKKANSLRHADAVALDAQSVGELYNGMVEAFPALGQKLTLGKLAEPAQPAAVAPVDAKVEPKVEAAAPKPAPVADKSESTKGAETTPAPEPVANNQSEIEQAPSAETTPQSEGRKEKPYRSLIGSDRKVNRFLQAFKFPAEARSRLIDSGEPAKVIHQAFASAKAFGDFLGKAASHKLSPELLKAYQAFIAERSNPIKAELEARLKTFLAGKHEVGTVGQALELGDQVIDDPVQDWLRGRAANLVQSTDGKLAYNEELLQGSILGGLQWLINSASRPSRFLDDEAVADALGVDEGAIPDGASEIFNDSLSQTEVIQGLADVLQRFWGGKPRSEAGIGYTRGIPEGMAAELLHAMEAAGLLRTSQEKLLGKTWGRVWLTEDEKSLKQLKELAQYPNAIEDLVVVHPEQSTFIGSPPAKIAETQTNNPLIENSDEHKAIIKKNQDTEHFVDQHFTGFMEAIGSNGALTLWGGGDLRGRTINVNHALSLRGQNITVAGAYEVLMATLEEVRSVAAARGVEPHQVAIHYAWNFAKNGRLTMQGAYNPQASKVSREMILPTQSTLDLTDPAQKEVFFLALAQAWGEKVHKMSVVEAAGKAQALATGAFRPAVDLMLEHLDGGELSLAQLQTIRSTLGAEASPAAVRALLEYARYLRADERKPFVTNAYVEADGVTNGVVNALMHLSTGEFDGEWVANMARGGLFFGAQRRSVAEFLANSDSEAQKDLYNVGADAAHTAVNRQLADYQQSFPKVGQQLASLLNLMNRVLPAGEISFDPTSGDLTIGRKAVKNPMTVSLYGSGVGGIADKVTGAIVRGLYERLTDYAEGRLSQEDGAELDRLVSQLTTTQVWRTKEGVEFVKKLDTEWPDDVSPKAFTLTSDQWDNLKQNVEKLYVDSLVKAIDHTTRSTLAGRSTLQRALQAQSVYAATTFQDRVNAKVEQLIAAGGQKNAYLSQDQLDEIWRSLKGLLPVMQLAGMSILVAGKDRSDIHGKGFGASLTNKLRARPSVFGPADAGVSGLPYTVIGFGDALMIQMLNAMKDGPSKKLDIFDGVHLALENLYTDAAKVNQAVHETWQHSPLGAAQQTFDAFLSQIEGEELTDNQFKAMVDAMFPADMRDGVSREDVIYELKSLQEHLKSYAQEAEARHYAVAQVQTSVDQMASSGSPYQQSEGLDLTGQTPEQVAQALNELYRSKLAELRSEEATPVEAQPESKPGPQDRYAQVDPVSEASVIPQAKVSAWIRSLKLPAEQKNLLLEAVKTLADRWEVVVGSDAQVRAYAERAGDQTPKAYPGRQTLGWTSTRAQRIYLTTRSAETVTHELIHAALTEKILGHYTGTGSAETAGHIEKLEALQAQWMALDPAAMSREQRQAWNDALGQVRLEQGNPQRSASENKAAALDEFLAWTLSNRELIGLAQQSKVHPLVRVIKQALISLKNLIWGRKNGPMVSGDLYSSLRFHTSLLIQSAPTLTQRARNVDRFHAPLFGEDPRLSALFTGFTNKLGTWLDSFNNPLEKHLANEIFESQQKTLADQVAGDFIKAGWDMTPQQQALFQLMLSTFATQAQVDPASMARAQELFNHVTKQLATSAALLEDPSIADAEARGYEANQRRNVLLGLRTKVTDVYGRSTLLPAFLALAMVHDGFRQSLSQVELPKGVKFADARTFDQAVGWAGESLMNLLAKTISGEGHKQPHVKAAVDSLLTAMVAGLSQRELLIGQVMDPVSRVINEGNDLFKSGMQAVSKGVVTAATQGQAKLAGQPGEHYMTLALEGIKKVASLVDETEDELVSEGLLSVINRTQLFSPIYDLINELVGQTESNAPLQSLVKAVRAYVQQTRQQFREHLPQVIAGKFQELPTKEEWSHLFAGLGKTDFAALVRNSTVEKMIGLLTDGQKLRDLITTLELQAQKELADPKDWARLQDKAQQLAHYLVSGETGQHLLRNAEAVATLYQGALQAPAKPSPALVHALDQLISLYALDQQPIEVKKTLGLLSVREKAGMSFLINNLIGQRKSEQLKLTTDEGLLNHYKGYLPSEPAPGLKLTVADVDQEQDLQFLGMKKVADYKGSPAEHGKSKKAYYFAPVNGRAPFNQGVMQNVRSTVSGVDPSTGYSVGPMTAGRIVNPAVVQRLARTQVSRSLGGEPLLPVFNADGQVVAYERSVDPEMEKLLRGDTHLAKAIGVWRGRQMEEALSGQFNQQLLGVLGKTWQDQRSGRRDEFLNLFDPDLVKRDPVLADAIKLMTPEMRQLVKETYGEQGGFWVRKDMAHDAVGYRSASVGDLWTGISRWDQKAVDTVRDVAIGVFGKDAYKYLTIGEKLVQNLVRDAKQTIVVKSVTVAMNNIIANVYQMMASGIGPLTIAKALPRKLAETHAFTQRRLRQIDIEAELNATRDVVRTRQLRAELQSLHDANKRMSIWPLVQSGELSSITQAGNLEKEVASLFEGNLTRYVEHQVDKLPPALKTAGKYALLSEDTALYRGLQHALEYGDFLAKAISYDHLVATRGFSSQQAIDRVRNEYVNYDRLPGRFRGYAESIGLMWFWNFKVRSTKVAVTMLRENPLQALLTSLVPTPTMFGNVGTPLSDNLLVQAASGHLGPSLGPGMGLRAHQMLPLANLFGG